MTIAGDLIKQNLRLKEALTWALATIETANDVIREVGDEEECDEVMEQVESLRRELLPLTHKGGTDVH